MDPFGYPLPGSEVFEYLEEIGHGRFSEVRFLALYNALYLYNETDPCVSSCISRMVL